MKKAMDKLLSNIKFDKRYVFFSLIIVILGIITGALFIVMLKNEDKTLVIEYIESFIENIKTNKINYTDIVFNMMGEYFTLGELQQVYEVILGKKLLDPAFRRIIANKVEKTNKMKTGAGHRPSYLYRYKKK